MGNGNRLLAIAAVGVFVAGAGILALSVGSAPAGAAGGYEDYLGSIDAVGFNFAPRGWAMCDGQLLAISSNQALFSLLGTYYGGDGRTTFGLPDLRGRVPMHAGRGPGLTPRRIAEKAGSETNTLTVAQLPSHTHAATSVVNGTATLKANGADSSANNSDPNGQALARGREDIYGPGPTTVAMHPSSIELSVGSTITVANTGGGQSVNNMQPYLVVNFIIALQGTFPSRS